jgi:hypothetical protein
MGQMTHETFVTNEVSMEFQPISGVDIPTPQQTRRNRKYPFATMEVGEVFFVPGASKTFAGQVTAAGRRLGRKFVPRRVFLKDTGNGYVLADADTPDAVPAIGVWRVADDAVLRKKH